MGGQTRTLVDRSCLNAESTIAQQRTNLRRSFSTRMGREWTALSAISRMKVPVSRCPTLAWFRACSSLYAPAAPLSCVEWHGGPATNLACHFRSTGPREPAQLRTRLTVGRPARATIGRIQRWRSVQAERIRWTCRYNRSTHDGPPAAAVRDLSAGCALSP